MKTILDFILNENNINMIFLIGIFILPVLGFLSGVVIGKWRDNLQFYIYRGLFLGAFGPINWLMWQLYNKVTDHYGLDTVKNLLMNLAIFATLGLLLGLVMRYWFFTGELDPNAGEIPTEKSE